MLPSGERAKNARSISLPSLWQYYLVVMATSLDKLENKEQIHPSCACKSLSYGEKIMKMVKNRQYRLSAMQVISKNATVNYIIRQYIRLHQ